MHAIYYPGSVMTGRPDGFGRTSGSGIFTIKIVFLPYLQISVIMRFCIIFHSNFWLYVSLFIWFITVVNLVCPKFSKHVILHIWKVSNLHLWPEFKNFFNYAIWNFEMIFENSIWKIFSKLPIFYLIFYVHYLLLKIAFFKRFSKKGY